MTDTRTPETRLGILEERITAIEDALFLIVRDMERGNSGPAGLRSALENRVQDPAVRAEIDASRGE